jgi:hypothetical protein
MPAQTDTRLKNPVAIPLARFLYKTEPGESSITAGEWFKKLMIKILTDFYNNQPG